MSNEKTYCEQHGHFCRRCDSQIPLIDGNTSDGHHTFNELYEHRITLWIALCRQIYLTGAWDNDWRSTAVWRSRLHSDGSIFDGWFILGAFRVPGKQVTYHVPLSRWDECDFSFTLERAPEYDGHTPADVLERLKRL